MPKSILLRKIKSLCQVREITNNPLRGEEMNQLPSIENAFLLAEDGVIKDFGPDDSAPANADEVIDCEGSFVLPTWCDSHSHLVFAGSRESEFVDKIHGLSYEEIAERGGGILNSAQRLAHTPEEELLESAYHRLQEVISFGTGAIEIKSGYGLSYEAELKMLRVIRKLREVSPIPIKATFLGAHTYPMEFRSNHQGYIDILIQRLLPEIAAEGLADYVDVFCEKGFFALDETAQILEAASAYGLRPKIHVNQLTNSGGIQLGLRHGALSLDHLECLGEEEIALLADSDVICTALPSCSFYLGIPFAPVKKLIDAGAAVALATDYNPGSSPSGKMPFVLSLACIKMKLLPGQAINAMTANGAHAMGLASKLGSIGRGKTASLIITRQIPSLAYLPYSFGSDHIKKVVLAEEIRHF